MSQQPIVTVQLQANLAMPQSCMDTLSNALYAIAGVTGWSYGCEGVLTVTFDLMQNVNADAVQNAVNGLVLQ